MNRGSTPSESPPDSLDSPSMRPRFMNRGSGHRVRSLHALACPFNEAPIHESGKSMRERSGYVTDWLLQ